MHKHKRRNEGILYEPPITRNKMHDDVREELAGAETFLTDMQGLKLAYENPDGIYQNGSIIYSRNQISTGYVGRFKATALSDTTYQKISRC